MSSAAVATLRPCLLLLFLLAGCRQAADLTGGSRSSLCAVHGTRMSRQRVPAHYGLVWPSETLAFVDPHAFPNTDDPVDRGCCVEPESSAWVLVCPDCIRARDRWLREHPEVHDVLR